VVATQRATVPVPDLRNRTEQELVAILLENDLQPGARAEANDPDVPATLVVRTDPRSGIEVARGTMIDYTLSLGPAPTPTAPPPVTEPPPDTPPPTVGPAPTAPTAPPATVIIITPEPQTPIIITPPPPPPTAPPTPEPTPVLVGNYSTCAPLSQVREQIVAAGLIVGVVFPFEADDSWQVAQQFPAPGEFVPPGTEVDLLVKSPADPCP
jgi:beta-lactam-binding protein with PASTA domain